MVGEQDGDEEGQCYRGRSLILFFTRICFLALFTKEETAPNGKVYYLFLFVLVFFLFFPPPDPQPHETINCLPNLPWYFFFSFFSHHPISLDFLEPFGRITVTLCSSALPYDCAIRLIHFFSYIHIGGRCFYSIITRISFLLSFFLVPSILILVVLYHSFVRPFTIIIVQV